MTERRKSPTSPPSNLSGSAVSVEILSDTTAKKKRPDPMAVVIFGATGDLAGRKLAPALFNLMLDGTLPEPAAIVGVARNEMDKGAFAEHIRGKLNEFSRQQVQPSAWEKFAGMLDFVAGDFADDKPYL